MVVERSPHGDFHYTVVTRRRTGVERVHEFAAETELQPGDVLRLDGRFWLIADARRGGASCRRRARPAIGCAFVIRTGGKRSAGCAATGPTLRGSAIRSPRSKTRQPVSWEVVNSRLGRDDQGAFLEFAAERDFAEVEELPDHELEHTLARSLDDELPESARAAFERAERSGLSIELVALEPGEEPDWEEADRFIDALVIEEINDDLLELCGVNPDTDPKDGWLETVRSRLRDDLTSFRDDIEGEHEQIEQWSFRDGRIFASIGSEDDESDPLSGHGWLCRLVDADVHGAAGFVRVRKARACVITGTTGADVLRGKTARRALRRHRRRQDLGAGGNDFLIGGPGHDRLFGGARQGRLPGLFHGARDYLFPEPMSRRDRP